MSENYENVNVSGYQSPLDVEKIILLMLLFVFSVAGVIGNTLVLVVYRVKRDYSVSTFFIKVLAVIDLMACLFVIPSTLYMEYYRFIIWNDFVCKVYHFLITSNIPFSALVMVAIAIERYICICHPFASGLNLPRAKVLTFALLVCSGVFGIITSLLYGIYIPKNQNNITVNYNTSNVTFKLNQSEIKIEIFDEVTDKATPTTESWNNTFWNTTFAEKSDSSTFPSTMSFEHQNQILPGECYTSLDIFSYEFVMNYQKIYGAVFLVEFCIICVLYLLIYRSVVQHRSRKRKRRQSNGVPVETLELNDRGGLEASQLCETVSSGPTGDTHSDLTHQSVRWKRRYSFLRDRNRVANIKTAAILFVVTLVFVLSYFPSWLMAYGWIPYNVIVFYLYFLNNVANPIIYAFMNRNFRTNLAEALTWYKRHKSNCCCIDHTT